MTTEKMVLTIRGFGQSSMDVLYIDDYMTNEESALRQLNVNCIRLSYEDAISGKLRGLPSLNSYLLRTARLKREKFDQIFTIADSANIRLSTNSQSQELGSNFAKQFIVLKDFYPHTIITAPNLTPSEILNELRDSHIRFPVFLRSDVESAAKYVGFEGCLVSAPDEQLLNTALQNLQKNVTGYTQLIFKEIVSIKRDPQTNVPLEYRAIGLGGTLVMFDEASKAPSVQPETMKLDTFAQSILDRLASHNATGGFFVDVAMTEPNRPMLVECKSLTNGSIKSIDKLALLLKGYSL